MRFSEFMEKVRNALEKYFSEEYQIRIIKVKKNNGLLLHGLSILPADSSGAGKISPTIYLEEYFESYEEGVPLSEIVQEIVKVYDKHKINANISMDFFLDYEKVRKRIVFKLINYEKNEELLQEIPYIPFLDLAIVFYYHIENEVFGTASILIYQTHMKNWGITLKQIMKDAERNTPKLLEPYICNMEDMMRKLIKNDLCNRSSRKKDNPDEDAWLNELVEQMLSNLIRDREVLPMYVLSNRNSQNGAACILYPEVLKEFAGRMKSNLYILPSSIHEVIIIGDNGMEEPEILKDMVKDVNDTQLAPEEVLSDQVYYFNKNNGNIRICECEKERKTEVK